MSNINLIKTPGLHFKVNQYLYETSNPYRTRVDYVIKLVQDNSASGNSTSGNSTSGNSAATKGDSSNCVANSPDLDSKNNDGSDDTTH